MADDAEAEVRELYRRIIDGWNQSDGNEFAAPFADDGVVIGFDGSESNGREAIADEMNRIFADHETGTYVGKVRDVRMVGPDAALLRAVAGVIPAGRDDLEPKQNSAQSLVAERSADGWRVVLYHNTPAQYHGRPEAVESLTAELREERQSTP
jgi:uncharacterized protein (TIGR02246 family)